MLNKKPAKISKLSKAWKLLAKDQKNYEKTMNFYEAFLNTKFWIRIDNRQDEKIKVSFDQKDFVPLFENYQELQKMDTRNYKKGEKMVLKTIKQHGGEIIYALSKNTKYAIKIKGKRDFVFLYQENITFIKENFGQK